MTHKCKRLRLVCGCAALLLVAALTCAHAIEPEEQLKDPALEARARALSSELRCLVCENETIEASQAPLAGDLRHLVRQRIVAGDSNAQIRELLRERYGDYVLFRPRFDLQNALLWLGPFAVLLIAGVILLVRVRSMNQAPSTALSAEEEARLESLLTEDRTPPDAGSGATESR